MTLGTLGLRGRLVLVQLGVFTLLLGAASAARYAWIERTYFTEMDDGLRSTATVVARSVREAQANGVALRDAAVEVVDRTIFAERTLLITDRAGHRLAVGRAADGAPSLRALATGKVPTYPTTVVLDGADVRVLCTPLGPQLLLIVAQSLMPLERRLHDFREMLIVTTTAVILVGGLIAWWVARRLLRPVTSIAAAAQRLSEEVRNGATAFGRLPKAPGDDEVAMLTRDFNRLLVALEAAFTRERHTGNRFRQFLADAAHELRTPIAIVRAEAESALHESDSAAQQAALRSVAAEAARLGTIVGDLMMLARRDAGGPTPRTRVFLDDLATSAVARIGAHPVAEGRQLRLGEFDAAPVMADREALERAIVILVHNALVHAAPSPVEVSTGVHFTSEGAKSWVRVRDWGPGIPIQHQDRIFERFARLDHSRPGTGLGLAIARAIAEEAGGTLTVESETGDGAVFLLELPCADTFTDDGERVVPASESLPDATPTGLR